MAACGGSASFSVDGRSFDSMASESLLSAQNSRSQLGREDSVLSGRGSGRGSYDGMYGTRQQHLSDDEKRGRRAAAIYESSV